MAFQTPITIAQAIERIDSNAYLLPAIQREFEWADYKIEWLFDSILRGYPFGSFLFWQVRGETRRAYRFYKFLRNYRQRYMTHNEEYPTANAQDFIAVLDGQQRLTSLYIGLRGSHAIRRKYVHEENTERVYPTRYLYLNIAEPLQNEEDGRIYQFKFLTPEDAADEARWFKVGRILELKNVGDFMRFLNGKSEFAVETLSRLHQVIFQESIINYYLEEEQNIDKALNIFIRINSGGQPLSFSDLLVSIAIANWKHLDARSEFNQVVDAVREKGFTITRDFVLKTFLYLYSTNIKFLVTNFSAENAEMFEERWEGIRDAILTAFDLARSFGFVDYSLRAKNALLPIIYYMYHHGIYRDFVQGGAYAEDRKRICKWLHIVQLAQLFGRAADSVLVQMRQKFVANFGNGTYIDPQLTEFPSTELLRGHPVAPETITELLARQKDDGYSFSILALLYPNLEYRYNDFHKDHLHAADMFTEACAANPDAGERLAWGRYNSIVNLQLLDSRENESKGATPLAEWVENQCAGRDRAAFLANHLIPDVDLSLAHAADFFDARERLLCDRLRALMNLG